MAGITKALKRVSDGKNIGKVLALGFLTEPHPNQNIFKDCTMGDREKTKKIPDTPRTKYAIIQLDDGGCITEYDYESDVQISDKLKEGDDCILEIVDNYCAEWRKLKKSQIKKVDEIYFSVGTTTCDLKAGSPNITITNGIATFSCPQIHGVGVGDMITYGNNDKCYISKKESNTIWEVKTEKGKKAKQVSDQKVNKIGRAFNSLNECQDGAAKHLGTKDLVKNNRKLYFMYHGPLTGSVTIDGWITSKECNINIIGIGNENSSIASSASVSLPSQFKLDDNVIVNFFEAGTIEDCTVHAVRLTQGKVFYDIKVTVDLGKQIILKDIDSAFIEPVLTRPILQGNRKIFVESDGTPAGTHITVDGKAMGYLSYFKFVADLKKPQVHVVCKNGEEIK